MKYVNLTPRWAEILPTWLMMYRQGVTGDCSNPTLVMANAKAEFVRMAQAADNANDLIAFVRESEGWTDEAIKGAISIGRGINERERSTVKESQDDLS